MLAAAFLWEFAATPRIHDVQDVIRSKQMPLGYEILPAVD
jgi:hypothetical protein